MSQYIQMTIPKPMHQALIAGGAALIMMIGGRFVSDNPLFAWMTSGAFLLLFMVFNAAVGIFADNFGKYMQQSFSTFPILLIGMGLGATLISGIGIFEAKPYRTIYIIMVLAYFSLLAISTLIRKVADFLLERDQKRMK